MVSEVLGSVKFLAILVIVAISITVMLEIVAGLIYADIIAKNSLTQALLTEHINATKSAMQNSQSNVEMTQVNHEILTDTNRIAHEVAALLAANNITLTSANMTNSSK